MTDKQIIIDGVDVSGCRCLAYPEADNPMCTGLYLGCKNNNCEYKNWKRKEQECEELKSKIKFMEEYVKTVENTRDELEQQLDQLKTENKRLKWYLDEIRNEELKLMDIDWDEYETHCIDTEYTNIINLVEEALEERSPEDCRYGK